MDVFKGIDLNDSFVLSWELKGKQLCFTLEASIWPNSPHYQMPTSGEYTCYRTATLCFVGCDGVDGLKSMSEVRANVDASGEPDFGNIDSLAQTQQGFEISGDFGNVEVLGGRLEFRIEP